jgi:hypothetical protein
MLFHFIKEQPNMQNWWLRFKVKFHEIVVYQKCFALIVVKLEKNQVSFKFLLCSTVLNIWPLNKNDFLAYVSIVDWNLKKKKTNHKKPKNCFKCTLSYSVSALTCLLLVLVNDLKSSTTNWLPIHFGRPGWVGAGVWNGVYNQHFCVKKVRTLTTWLVLEIVSFGN